MRGFRVVYMDMTSRADCIKIGQFWSFLGVIKSTQWAVYLVCKVYAVLCIDGTDLGKRRKWLNLLLVSGFCWRYILRLNKNGKTCIFIKGHFFI